MRKAILGISAYYHDSAAALLVDGELVAAAQEERFTRKKHDPAFPINACRYVLEEAGVKFSDLSGVAFYDKPFLKFERLLETYHALAPEGVGSFLTSMPVWIKEKLFTRRLLDESLRELGEGNPPVYYPEHHLSHAASAFYPSPYQDAAILTIDGVGEWATTTISKGSGADIEILKELQFPHSVGLLYSAFTYYTGFQVNSGEYKLMGLAPYGDPFSKRTEEFKRKTLETLIDVRPDGSMLLNMDYFQFATGLRMTNDAKWMELFGIPRRAGESDISQEYMDMALAIQQVTEEIVLRLARTARELTGSRNICLAGGVALNCVANGKLMHSKIFDSMWIQPAAGDAGGAVGAAYATWHIHDKQPRTPVKCGDAMSGSYLGPEFTDKEARRALNAKGAKYRFYDQFDELTREVADILADGKVVGWVQGRMEFGPRSLGCRSILGDARNAEMQKKMNLKIKYREGFRPFAPSVMEEHATDYFDLPCPSPYMLIVTPIQESRKNPLPPGYHELPLMQRLYHLRSDLPAITHVDYSARIQTVSKHTNPRYWELINAFKEKTGYGVIVNTSFNVRGEPIVCSPEDAYRCFMRSEMDYLVVGNFLMDRREQPVPADDADWRKEFKLD